MRRNETFFHFRMGFPGSMTGGLSAIIYVNKHGLGFGRFPRKRLHLRMWRDAPWDYGPHKTIYKRFTRWSCLSGTMGHPIPNLARGGSCN